MALATAPSRPPVGGSGRLHGRGDQERSGPVRGAGPLRDWCVFALVITGRIYRALLISLALIAVLPTLWNWSGYLVRSGSMEPAISAGDVVVGRPFAEDAKVPVGRVMLFEVPTEDGSGSTIRIHRVVASLGQDSYATAGDANGANDPDPVAREDFVSRAVIRVPYIGLPVVWLADGDHLALILWLAATVLLVSLSFRHIDGDPPRRRRTRKRAQKRGATGLAGTALAVAATVTGAVAPTSASAAFTATTANTSNTWRVGSTLQPYTAEVLADSPHAFYRLEEPSGTAASDTSGNGRTGTYAAVAAYHQSGGLPNNFGYAIGLAGAGGRMVGGGTGLSDPTTFSVEVWFRTTTSSGGKLIGFESTRNQTSTFYDREAFMRTDGRVVYMGATSTSKLLVSPTALNNGQWHHLVITAVPQGSNETTAMYVDGTLVASGNTAKASVVYTGWWRVGYGRVPAGTGYPLNGNFTGSLDEVAIYRTQLSAARVAAHYTAR